MTQKQIKEEVDAMLHRQHNRKDVALNFSTMTMALALTRKRMVATYGKHYFCTQHKYLVDKYDLDNCHLIQPNKGTVSEIRAFLKDK
jgi:hypothetical protein